MEELEKDVGDGSGTCIDVVDVEPGVVELTNDVRTGVDEVVHRDGVEYTLSGVADVEEVLVERGRHQDIGRVPVILGVQLGEVAEGWTEIGISIGVPECSEHGVDAE